MYPAGVAVDDTDNIYVSSQHKLQKFTSSGELIKCIGRRGSKEEEFDFVILLCHFILLYPYMLVLLF